MEMFVNNEVHWLYENCFVLGISDRVAKQIYDSPMNGRHFQVCPLMSSCYW